MYNLLLIHQSKCFTVMVCSCAVLGQYADISMSWWKFRITYCNLYTCCTIFVYAIVYIFCAKSIMFLLKPRIDLLLTVRNHKLYHLQKLNP